LILNGVDRTVDIGDYSETNLTIEAVNRIADFVVKLPDMI